MNLRDLHPSLRDALKLRVDTHDLEISPNVEKSIQEILGGHRYVRCPLSTIEQIFLWAASAWRGCWNSVWNATQVLGEFLWNESHSGIYVLIWRYAVTTPDNKFWLFSPYIAVSTKPWNSFFHGLFYRNLQPVYILEGFGEMLTLFFQVKTKLRIQTEERGLPFGQETERFPCFCAILLCGVSTELGLFWGFESESGSVVSDSLRPHGLGLQFMKSSRPEYQTG